MPEILETEQVSKTVSKVEKIDENINLSIKEYKETRRELENLLDSISDYHEKTSVKISITELLRTAEKNGVSVLREKIDIENAIDLNIYAKNFKILSDLLFPDEDEMIFDKVRETKKFLIRYGRLHLIWISYQ